MYYLLDPTGAHILGLVGLQFVLYIVGRMKHTYWSGDHAREEESGAGRGAGGKGGRESAGWWERGVWGVKRCCWFCLCDVSVDGDDVAS